jgi:AraC-like DNA-binding protein
MSRTEAKRRFTLADHRAATEGVECRKDKDVIDETPAAYKDIDAVMEAQRDLAYTTLSVKQIALGLGFADAGYFSRFFLRQTGHTPSAWRALAAR